MGSANARFLVTARVTCNDRRKLSAIVLELSFQIGNVRNVRFAREFPDALRGLFAPLMEPEVHFALLSRRADFPIAVPKCYFADYDPATKSGLLVTERIAYGQGRIERCHDKCVDYEIDGLLEHYQALTRFLAQLTAAHKAGRYGADTEQLFPFDAQRIDPGSRIPYTPEQLRGKLDKLKSFAKAVPQLFPGS